MKKSKATIIALLVAAAALSGVLAWTAFAPLVALPIVGVFRQKRLFDQVERDVVEWLASRYRLGCIDV